jgi:hypothetical protein
MHRLSLALLFLCAVGCASGERTVEEVMRRRERALATADAALYASLISPDYRDRGIDSRTKLAELEHTLKAFGPVAYRSLGRTVSLSGDTATVTGRYAMKVSVKGKPVEFAGEETIRLRREGGAWRIVGGL